MTASASPPEPPPRLAMALLVPEADGIESLPDAGDPGRAKGVLLDPYSMLARLSTAWFDFRSSPDASPVRLDLPHRDPEDLYELLETLYALHGWKGVDSVIAGVQRALAAEAIKLFPLPARDLGVPRIRASASAHYAHAPLDLDKALRTLIASAGGRGGSPGILAGLKAIAPDADLFSQDRPRAGTRLESSLDPQVAARLFAEVLLAMQPPRAALVARVRNTLYRVENETRRLIGAALNGARSGIIRETTRYFTLQPESAEAALENLHDLAVSRDDSKAEPDKRIPPARDPKALQDAIKEILPFARRAVSLDASPRGTPSSGKMIEAELAKARSVLAREVGRRAQAFPLLCQIGESAVRPASEAGVAALGGILFPLLTRAHKANKSMRARSTDFSGVGEIAADARHPESALAGIIARAGEGKSSWSYRKYVEKAAARMVPEGDDIGRRCMEELAEAMGRGEGPAARALSLAAGEMLVLGTAAHFATRLVPVLNVASAAWHIASAVREFHDRHDEFYCALDPREALADTAPSAAGLAVDIATETAFAFL